VEFVDRNVAGTVVYAMGYARVVALLGPRQAGKSTLARKLAAEQLSADYLSLDDDPVRSLAAGDPAGFIAARGRCTVIDEVQRAPELAERDEVTASQKVWSRRRARASSRRWRGVCLAGRTSRARVARRPVERL
jgi:predicted AAA+ superfamily ATPase